MGLADLSGLAYPWDTLTPYAERARAHPRGVVDLSIGTPVDPTPAVVRDALAAASDAHGYPTTHGTPALRETVSGWFSRRRGVPGLDPDAVLPIVGRSASGSRSGTPRRRANHAATASRSAGVPCVVG